MSPDDNQPAMPAPPRAILTVVGCLDDAALYELIHGRLAPAVLAGVDAHLDGCDACRDLVAVVARGSDGRDAPAADELRAGDAVDRYLVLGRLGGGAMGVVYAAHDGELDRPVALKLLRPQLAAGSGGGHRDRVLREAQAMARLQHPNVVAVHDVGTAGDRVFVAMELVAGPTLRVWAVDRPWRARLACLRAVGRGLAAAHAAGVIHRDVKPDNIIVDAHDRPRLGDFGLARADERDRGAPAAAATTSTQTGAVLGTPRYMAPEQLRGEPATAQSDQFGFAVTAWEILFGARPFAGDDLAALAAAIGRGPAPPTRRGVPASVERGLRRALAAAPAARFAGVAELVAALDVRPRRWRWPAGALAAAGAAAALVLVTRPAAPAPAIDPCRTAAAALADTWTPAIADELATRLAAAHDRTSAARLAAWTARWRDARLAVCRAGRVRGAQSEALLDVRAGCLDRGRAELAALIGELRAAAPATLTGAAEAVAALTDPDECAGSAALALLAPVAPAQRAAVAEVERTAAALRARLVSATPVDPAGGAALVTAATATGHAPTLAAAHLVHAELLRRVAAAPAADAAARASIVAAEIGHDDLGAARAWLARVGAAGERRDLDAVDEWGQLAAAAVTRAGAPPALVARLAHDLGLLAMNRGELDRAQRELDRALTVRRQLAGAQPDLDVARTVSALGHVARLRGDLPAALAHFTAALALEEALLDPAHPEAARDRHNRAGVLRLQGALDEALAEYDRALALRVAALGPDHPDVGLTHNSLGLVALERGDLARASAELTAARRILAATGHGDLPIALANLGVLALRQGEPRAALALLDDAVARYRATLPARHEHLARALLDATRAAAAARDPRRAAALLRAARAAIPAEAGARFVREADELAATLAPAPPAPPPAATAATPPPTATPPPPPAPVGTYGSSQGWN